MRVLSLTQRRPWLLCTSLRARGEAYMSVAWRRGEGEGRGVSGEEEEEEGNRWRGYRRGVS